METEADLTQDPTTTEGLEQENAVETTQEPEEAAVVPAPEEEVEAAAPETPEQGEPEQGEPEQGEEANAEAAASAGDDAPIEAEKPEAEEDVIVATEDVAPAQPKIELARIAKESLIERAKELADSTDWRKTSDAQRALMEEWRAAGYAGKEYQDKLWDEFRAARDVFFTRRDEHYAELREQQGKVVEAKRQIIEEAKALVEDIQNWRRTADAMDELMNRWKTAGNAGRDNEHVLWEEFNGIRKDFRNRRKADLAARRAKERQNAETKRAIVDEAAAIAEAAEYSRENSDRMRELNEAYKAAGYAGKPANDTLWTEFRKAQSAYWDGNSAFREQRKRERSERLSEVVERKTDQMEHIKSQNETLTTRLGSTLNPEKIAQIKQWIEENEQRIDGLQDDITDIKKKI